jgi:hypothetical protein
LIGQNFSPALGYGIILNIIFLAGPAGKREHRTIAVPDEGTA